MDRTRALFRRFVPAFLVFTLFCRNGLAEQPKPTIERLRPNGIDGTVMVVGDGEVPEAVKKRFVELAGGEKAKLAIVLPKSVADATVKSSTAEWEERKPASVSIVKDGDSNLSQATREATGVWLAVGGVPADDLKEVIKRSGLVACVGKPALHHVGELLPDATFALKDKNAAAEAKKLAKPGWACIVVEDGTALIVRRRDVRVVGGGKVCAALAAGAGRPDKLIEWKAGTMADYNALVHSAIARTEPPFPPKECPVPEVASGSLVIVGGGGMPADVTKKFIDLAGGPDALIIVLPIAMPDPVPANEAQFFVRNGAKHMEMITSRELADVDSPKNLELLRKAGGVWFGGGRQWHFVDSYAGTKFGEELRNVLKRGGVIGGSSAGATIQGDYLCRGDPLGPNPIICEGYERGLGFLPGVGIDQHFTQRKRQPDMTKLMSVYPQLLGIGLDEATAIVVKGHVAEVMGRGKAHFYDRRKPVEDGKPDYEAFPAGARYDLKDRKVLPSESAKPEANSDQPKKLDPPSHQEVNTFSIVAYDPERKEWGIGVASKFLAVGSVVPWAKAGAGAVATQAYANTNYGPKGLDLLAQGKSADEVIKLLTEADNGKDSRQIGIVDAKGNGATYTGPKCQTWAGGKAGKNYACQGNILAGEAVVNDMAKAFEESKGPLAWRIITALEAADKAGGDRRGKQSAAILVVREKSGFMGFNDRYLDFRVDDHEKPIEELARILGLRVRRPK